METHMEVVQKATLPGIEAASFSANLDQMIKGFIYSDEADKYGRTKDERVRDYEQFRNANLYSLKKAEKRLSHRHISVILNIIGDITFRELFSECGIPVNWPDHHCEQMAIMFSGIDKKDIEFITDLCLRLCPTCMRNEATADLNPTKRAMEYFQHSFSSVIGSRQLSAQVPKHLSETIKQIRRGKKTMIPFEDLPLLLEKMSASMKWVLGVKADVAVMSRDLLVDNAMDMYLRLPAFNRKQIDYIVETLYEDKKKKEGK